MKIIKNKKLISLLTVITLTLLVSVSCCLAQPTIDQGKVESLVLEDAIERVINWGLSILVLVAALMIIYAGIKWITAGGDDGELEKARKVLTAGITGLIIAVVAYGIIRVITTIVLAYGIIRVITTVVLG